MITTELDERLIEITKRELDKRGWKQKELAVAMDIAESEISELLNRKRRWTLHLINLLNQATGVNIQI